jgi:GTPase SAR1 family protein
MGICGSSDLSPEEVARLNDEKNKSRALTDKIRDAQNRDQHLNKLLLLGAGESGKSTLFKQMVMIYGTDGKMSEEDRKAYIELVFSNIIHNAKTLAENSHKHGAPQTPQGIAARDYIEEELEDDDRVDAKVAQYLNDLWTDPGIQECYENRALYQLNDSTKYFMDKVTAISQPDWVPNEDDIVRTRVRTTGIVEHNFEIEDNKFRMFDVGGQRNERKKWIHCFESVTALMFVAAISEFDQVLYEDEHTNRMTEALHLFDDIANSFWFKTTSIILFLNKIDLFREKIVKKDITDSACEELQAFDGDCRDEEETTEFIRELFEKKNEDKQIITHKTCATNQKNVQMVFDSVKEIIIKRSLEEAGLY